MRQRTLIHLFGSPINGLCLLGLGLLLTLTTNAQNKPTPDKEMDRVRAMMSQAQKDADKFSKSGGKPSDPNNPRLKWSAAFWQYREAHPGTPATVTATSEALRLLFRADRLSELQTKADTLKPDDPA